MSQDPERVPYQYIAQEIRRSGLPKSDRLVLLAINLLCSQGMLDPSEERLAEATGYKVSTVGWSLRRLQNAGILNGDEIDLFYLPPRKGAPARGDRRLRPTAAYPRAKREGDCELLDTDESRLAHDAADAIGIAIWFAVEIEALQGKACPVRLIESQFPYMTRRGLDAGIAALIEAGLIEWDQNEEGGEA